MICTGKIKAKQIKITGRKRCVFLKVKTALHSQGHLKTWILNLHARIPCCINAMDYLSFIGDGNNGVLRHRNEY